MAAQKLFAVFLVCLVVLAAVQVDKVEGHNFVIDQYKRCYDACHKTCFQDGKAQGYTFCEMKCDGECGDNKIATSLRGLLP